MVAAGATGLMSASDSSSSKEADNIPLHYKVQNAQRSCDGPAKTSVKLEKKNSLRNPSSNKAAASIRETKASRLRAASIVSPTEATPPARKSFGTDHSSASRLQTGTSVSRKAKSPMSTTSRPTASCGARETDRTPKRSLSTKQSTHTSSHEKTEGTRIRKRCIKMESSTEGSAEGQETAPSSSGIKSCSSSADDKSEVSRRVDALTALTRATMERVERLTSHSSPSVNGRLRIAGPEVDSGAPLLSMRKPSGLMDLNDSTDSGSNDASVSAEMNFASRQQPPPVSILKHKTSDLESSTTSGIFHKPGSSSTGGPDSIVQQFTKKHGILKKRSSLDDNEILRRRRSCSPDTAYLENNAVGLKHILINERRSSLDELVKRTRSPDRAQAQQQQPQEQQQEPHELQEQQQQEHQQQHHPTSILKRKSSGDEEREDGQAGSTEPTSILKRSSGNSGKPVGIGNHVSIVAAVAKTLGCIPDNINGSEVRPILKKKYSREESSSSDPASLEPRPILKKKSSTDSDEHDEKPKKTILKSSRKSSQEDSGNEVDGASPKKLSMLKNRAAQRRTNSLPECDVVRPILKQCSPRESSSPSRSSLSGTASPGDGATAISKDLFLRKRAQSVGHMQSSLNGREDWLEVEDSHREEMKHYSDSSANTACSEIWQSSDKSCSNDYEISPMCRQSSSRRRDKWDHRTVYGEHLPSKSQKSQSFEEERVDERKAMGAHMTERKTNVSQIAQRFKALEEQVMMTATEGRVNRKTTSSSEKYKRNLHEQQKYERFNTQPVTYEEVREAVLHNQRQAGTIDSGVDSPSSISQPSDVDPSKLSLADRVHLFNERIATETVAKVGVSLERSQRRRPANRYKTQPITSEEVEVAARSFSSEIVEASSSRSISHSRETLPIDTVQPRSILKYSQSQSASDNYSKSVQVSDICNRRMLQRRERSTECVQSSLCTTFESDPSEQELQETTVLRSYESTVLSQQECKDSTSESTMTLETRDKIIPEMEKRKFSNMSIADRLAALERSGTTDWKRRVNTEPVPASSKLAKFSTDNVDKSNDKIDKDELLTKQQKLAERLEKLESAAEGWRKRVVPPDAVKFSVAGKMMVNQLQVENLQVDRQLQGDGKKKTPHSERLRSYKSSTLKVKSPSEGSIIQGTPSEHNSEESSDESTSVREKCSILTIPRADDETFTSFFSSVSLAKCEAENLDFAESDFDVITTFAERLGSRRTVKTQRRRLQSKNPLRTLAARTDIKDEYTEMTTGVAERLMRTLNLEKLGNKSCLAIQALAGLASTEDFSSVTLKNVDVDSTGHGNILPPYKDVMLMLVKGRRHVQVRLVEPVAASINSGDNYILVTRSELYNYVGKYSNVIERARGAEIALSIQQHRDLGCRASQVITVSEEKATCTNNDVVNFWKILGVDNGSVEVIDGGHPDEDELYESALTETNMVYEVVGDYELLPIDKYWGSVPKIEMLDPSRILVFDFGSEMYIWNGKITPSEKRKVAIQLAQELWQEGYDYTEYTVSPVNSASIIGRRKRLETNDKKASARPPWCLIAKLTQHMETILFREKFLDWPNVSGIIRSKKLTEKEQVDGGKVTVEPPEVDAIIDCKSPVVDLILEGSHLGRGTGWYDDELMRQSIVATTNVTVWHIDEFSYSLLDGSSIGQFYTGDSYIVRWMYTVTITGRGLGGEPSKHASKGRDRCAYFIWQGQKASLNEQGAAALLTVQLDQEQGPQVRVVEGFEPAAFLNLFSGRMIVHMGKRSKTLPNRRWRLYTYRGGEKSEICLTEVPCSSRQLRSRGALLLIDTKFGEMYVWYGSAAPDHLKKNVLVAAETLKANRPEEAGLGQHLDSTIHDINEADEEPIIFYQALGGVNKQLYESLNGNSPLNHTPRLFNLSSVSGEFAATELLCPHRTDLAIPFPFLQNELYQVNQPALFLLDNKDELWLWQGWWPDGGSEDQTGSGAVRWQAERRAAMVMAVRYWKKNNPESNECPVYLAWAGLEPLSFTNLFPTWTLHDEIAELNIRDGRDPGQVLKVEGELARLTQSTYPPAQLLQRPLPDGVDPTILETYLSPQHFEELLGMNVEEFEQLPAWKQINIKKKIGLF